MVGNFELDNVSWVVDRYGYGVVAVHTSVKQFLNFVGAKGQ